MTLDNKKLRKLQREVRDRKAVVNRIYALYGATVLVIGGAILMIVIGDVVGKPGMRDAGIFVTAISVIVALVGSLGYFIDNDPFQKLRKAKDNLEDYYDEVGNSL